MRTIMQLALGTLMLLVALAKPSAGKPVWLNATWNTTAQSEVVTAGDFVAFGMGGSDFGGAVVSVNATTGFTEWVAPVDQNFVPPLVFVCDATPQLAFMVSTSSDDEGIYVAYSALNRSYGGILWTIPLPSSEASWICPPTPEDPLLIVTYLVLSVDPIRGNVLFDYYANTTNGVHLVNRCGAQETSTCFVYGANNVIHVVDVHTGSELSRTHLPVSSLGPYVAGSSADVFFVVAEEGTTAMSWNGTRVWASSSVYAAGNAKIWVSQGRTQNMSLTAFSTKTGAQLWNWPSAQEKLNTTSKKITVTFSGTDLPLISSSCYQGVDCSTAAFDPRTGAVKWIVYNQSLTTPQFACPSYALFSNETIATLVRIQDGETRYVQTELAAQAVAQTTSTILVQTSEILASYPRF